MDAMKRPDGYIKLLRIKGIPVFMHWAVPAGGIVLAMLLGAQGWSIVYCCIAFSSLIAIHELGHAVAAALSEVEIKGIRISAFGGRCFVGEMRTVGNAVAVYSGGFVAQFILLILTFLYIAIFPPRDSVSNSPFIITFTAVNLFFFFVNVIPYRSANGPPSDGYALWHLFLNLFWNRPLPFLLTKKVESRTFPPETRLLTMRDFIPRGFKVGVEILNDDTTPMGFVVSALTEHLKFDRDVAITLMIKIHSTGGILLSLRSLEDARTIAAAITAKSQEAGYNFICRAVELGN